MCLIQKDWEDTGAANQGQDKGGQGDMAQEAEETLKKQNKTQVQEEKEDKTKNLHRLHLPAD